ncbi:POLYGALACTURONASE [Salix koriyanagi]|uniref:POLYGALACTURONASE n=1 Tax=Salix koriyanagi TaxID=2511006 RepID=A0A9Q1A8I5_9ROSI|nr:POLYGALACTURONASE [Salix koriyanagi]
MGLKVVSSAIVLFSLLLLLASTAKAQSNGVFDVTKYGGKQDITAALNNAWKDACASTNPSKVLIPSGTYSLRQVTLAGPCKAAIELQVDGILKAPVDPNQFSGGHWVDFSHVDQLTLSGSGTFDGQGSVAWSKSTCSKDKNCEGFPMNIRFDFITNGLVRDITTRDSKNFHVNVLECKNLTFQHFTVTAPAESINTDGIHIGRSTGIYIIDSKIGTGDDCISVGDGTEELHVTGVTCGPGHGISVGSLGRYPNEKPVSGIFVKNCTISNTANGVRIKSWPDLYGGDASNMHFEDIVMNNVQNPVAVDQEYCPWNQCSLKAPSKVKISDVSFKNIRGTSATPVVVKLACSSGIPCEKVELADINLVYSGSEGPAKSQCSNVKPIISGIMSASGC